ncbi:MAG: hypothetical protein ACRDN1_03985 [Trebonia sp.]
MTTISTAALAAAVPPPRRDGEQAGLACAVDADALVLPAAIRAGHRLDGPRFADDVWDVSRFLPRTAKMTRIDFATIADPGHARTVREYLHSRLNRGIGVNQL